MSVLHSRKLHTYSNELTKLFLTSMMCICNLSVMTDRPRFLYLIPGPCALDLDQIYTVPYYFSWAFFTNYYSSFFSAPSIFADPAFFLALASFSLLLGDFCLSWFQTIHTQGLIRVPQFCFFSFLINFFASTLSSFSGSPFSSYRDVLYNTTWALGRA